MGGLALLMTVLAILGGLAARRRVQSSREAERLSDDMIRQIETRGWVDVEDEPLDIESAREAEEQFWDESTWDEPEQF